MIKNRCKKCGVNVKDISNHTCKIPWNKGLKGKQTAWNKGKNISQKHKDNLSKARKGTKQPNLVGPKNGMYGKIPHNKGKIGVYTSKRKGEKSNFWKGGVTPINRKIRTSTEYYLWRKSVFERDNYACIWCGSVEKIEADHIKPFSLFPELRFAIDNGRTLCNPCHRTTDTYGNKINTYKLT